MTQSHNQMLNLSRFNPRLHDFQLAVQVLFLPTLILLPADTKGLNRTFRVDK